LTKISIDANSAGNPATTDSTWSLSRTSSVTGKIRSPNSSRSGFSLSMRRAVATTRIPSFANRRAVAAPNPEDVPVTNATIDAHFRAPSQSASVFRARRREMLQTPTRRLQIRDRSDRRSVKGPFEMAQNDFAVDTARPFAFAMVASTSSGAASVGSMKMLVTSEMPMNPRMPPRVLLCRSYPSAPVPGP